MTVLFCEWLDNDLNSAYVTWDEDGQGMINWVDERD